jgi:hypothetical protein
MVKYTQVTIHKGAFNLMAPDEQQTAVRFMLPDSFKEDGAPFEKQYVDIFVQDGKLWENAAPLDYAKNLVRYGVLHEDKAKARKMVQYLESIEERDTRERLLARREELLFELLTIDFELGCLIDDDRLPVDCFALPSTPRARAMAESAANDTSKE